MINKFRTKKTLIFLSLLFGLLIVLAAAGFYYLNSIKVNYQTVANITDTSATIIWQTNKPIIGKVKLLPTAADLESVTLETKVATNNHYLVAEGLGVDTEYSYGYFLGPFSYHTADSTFKTQPLIEDLRTPDPAYGRLRAAEDVQTAEIDSAIVIVNVDGRSLSATVSENHTYTLDPGIVTKDFRPSDYSVDVLTNSQLVANIEFSTDQYKPLEDIVIRDKSLDSVLGLSTTSSVSENVRRIHYSDPNGQPNKRKIIKIGDSVTVPDGYLPAAEMQSVDQVVNAGEGGARIYQALDDYTISNIIRGELNKPVDQRPFAAVIMFGLNDCGWPNSPEDYSTYEKNGQLNEISYRANLLKLIDKLEKKSIVPILSPLTPTDNTFADGNLRKRCIESNGAASPFQDTTYYKIVLDVAKEKKLPVRLTYRLRNDEFYYQNNSAPYKKVDWNQYEENIYGSVVGNDQPKTTEYYPVDVRTDLFADGIHIPGAAYKDLNEVTDGLLLQLQDIVKTRPGQINPTPTPKPTATATPTETPPDEGGGLGGGTESPVDPPETGASFDPDIDFTEGVDYLDLTDYDASSFKPEALKNGNETVGFATAVDINTLKQSPHNSGKMKLVDWKDSQISNGKEACAAVNANFFGAGVPLGLWGNAANPGDIVFNPNVDSNSGGIRRAFVKTKVDLGGLTSEGIADHVVAQIDNMALIDISSESGFNEAKFNKLKQHIDGFGISGYQVLENGKAANLGVKPSTYTIFGAVALDVEGVTSENYQLLEFKAVTLYSATSSEIIDYLQANKFVHAILLDGSASAQMYAKTPGPMPINSSGSFVPAFMEVNQDDFRPLPYLVGWGDCAVDTQYVGISANLGATDILNRQLAGRTLAAEPKDPLQYEVTESGIYSLFNGGAKLAEVEVIVKNSSKKVLVKIFNDSNKNQLKEQGEFFTAASAGLELRRTGDAGGSDNEGEGSGAGGDSAQTYKLVPGWNLIGLAVEPTEASKTDGIFAIAASQEVKITKVASFKGGKFISLVEGDEEFVEEPDDFTAGKGYFVFLDQRAGSELIIKGEPKAGAVDYELQNGWNLLSFTEDRYKSKNSLEFLTEFSQNQSVAADNISKFESGNYQSSIIDEGVEYGTPYSIIENQGYFVRAYKN